MCTYLIMAHQDIFHCLSWRGHTYLHGKHLQWTLKWLQKMQVALWKVLTASQHSSSKLLRKDYGHAWGFLSLCIRSIYCHFLSGAAETCREVGSQIFFGCRRHGPSKAGTQQHFRAFSLSLSFSLLSVRAMFIPELVQRRAKSLNQVVLLAAPNAMA